VSTKIVSGIGILFILGLIVLTNQLTYVHQLEVINSDLADTNRSVTTVLRLRQAIDLLLADSLKYFALGALQNGPYEKVIGGLTADITADLTQLMKTARTDPERRATAEFAKAFADYQRVFNRFKDSTFDIDSLPPDLSIATNHLQVQSELALDVLQKAIRDKDSDAARIGERSDRQTRSAVLFSLLVSVIVVVLIVRAVNEPLRRLTEGIRAIAKGQFSYRLPARGSDEFVNVARDFNVMSETLGGLDHVKKDFENLLRECPLCGLCYDASSSVCHADGAELKLMMPLMERTVDRRYRLDRVIGKGGMGTVYQA